MSPDFKQGFEKTALIGKLMTTAMPKIFKWFSKGGVKGMASKGLGGYFVGDEALNIMRKTRQQVNKPQTLRHQYLR